MRYWLLKSEVDCYSIDDLKSDGVTLWTEVRNYQARNFLRQMSVGDQVLIYHSNASPAGVAGVGEVVALCVPDPTQFDRKSEYFDPRATPEKPRWFSPAIAYKETFVSFVPLPVLRIDPKFRNMPLLAPGQRLSVQPVSADHFKAVLALGRTRMPSL
jgi:predicted RNA-binding protein with PUA-like domain